MGVKAIIAKIPPKEQVFFGVVALFAVYIGVTTPRSAHSYDAVRRMVLQDPSVQGKHGESGIHAIYEQSQAGIAQTGGDSGGAQLVAAFEKRFESPPMSIPFKRTTPFRPDTDKYLPMSPATLSEVALAPIPGFDPPSGLAPETPFQVRPRLLPDGRVRLTKQDDDVPID